MSSQNEEPDQPTPIETTIAEATSAFESAEISDTSSLSGASTPKAKHNSPSPTSNKKNKFHMDTTITPSKKDQPSPSKSPRLSSSPRGGDYAPKGNLLKPTASRVHDVEVMEAKKKALEESTEVEQLKRTLSFKASPSKKDIISKKNANQPSDRLMKTTQARIADIRELEQRKDRINASDDIWWEMRKHAELATKKPGVQSKLHEPTQAFLQSNRPKYPLKSAPNAGPPPSPEKEHHAVTNKVISAQSPLLKGTRNSIVGAYNADVSEFVSLPSFTPTLVSGHSGPQNVPSKYNADTYASTTNKWKSKEQIANDEAAEIAATKVEGPKVKEVSERLLNLNANMKHSQRRKSVKEEGDPRENGWSKDFVKEHIPGLHEDNFSATQRRASLSPSGSRRSNDNGSVNNGYSSPMEKIFAFTHNAADSVEETTEEQATEPAAEDEEVQVQSE